MRTRTLVAFGRVIQSHYQDWTGRPAIVRSDALGLVPQSAATIVPRGTFGPVTVFARFAIARQPRDASIESPTAVAKTTAVAALVPTSLVGFVSPSTTWRCLGFAPLGWMCGATQ